MDILDRASFDLGGRKTPATIEGELAPSRPAHSAESGAVDLDVVRARSGRGAGRRHPAAGDHDHDRAEAPDAVALADVGAIIVVLAIAIGAFGMATYGYVAARDWGCKTGAFEKGCPAMPRRRRSGRHPGVAEIDRDAAVVHRGHASAALRAL